MDQIFKAVIEAIIMIREASESTARTVRSCVLIAILVLAVASTAAWLAYLINK